MFKILTCILCLAQAVFASCLEDVKDNFDTIWSAIDKNLRDGASPNDVDIPVFKGGNSLYNGQLLYAALYNFIQSRSTQYAYISVRNNGMNTIVKVTESIQALIVERLKDRNSDLTDGEKSFLTESACGGGWIKIQGNTLNLDGIGVVRPQIAIISQKTGEQRIVDEYIDNVEEDHGYSVVKKITINDYDSSIIEECIKLIFDIIEEHQNIDTFTKALARSYVKIAASEIHKKNHLYLKPYAIIPNIRNIGKQCQDINNIILEKQILKKIKDGANIYYDKIQQNYTQELMNMKPEHTTLKLFTNTKNMHISYAYVVDFLGAKFYKIEFNYIVGECFFDALQILRGDFWAAIDKLYARETNSDIKDSVTYYLDSLVPYYEEETAKKCGRTVSSREKGFWMYTQSYSYCALTSQIPIVVCNVSDSYNYYEDHSLLPYRDSGIFAFLEKAPIFIYANDVHFQLMIPVNWVKDNSFGYTDCSAHYKPVVDQLRKYLNIKTYQSDFVDTDCEDVCDFEGDTEC